MNLAAAVTLVSASACGLFSFVWLRASRAPGWQDTRWLAGTAATAALYAMCDFTQTLPFPDEVVRWGGRLSIGLAGLHCGTWFMFLEARDRRRLSGVERAVAWTGVAVAVAALVPGIIFTDGFATWTVWWAGVTYRAPALAPWGGLGLVYFLGAMAALVARTARHWREGWPMRLPLAGSAVLVAVGIHDALATAGALNSPLLMAPGFLVVVAGYGLTELRRLIADARRLEALSSQLGVEVQARTVELEQTLRALASAEKLAAVGQLAGGVAHEINNPAAVVLSNLRFLDEALQSWKEAPAELSEVLRDARTSMERIAAVVRSLSVAGQVAMRPGAGTRRHCDVNAVVHAAVERAAHTRGPAPRVEGRASRDAAFDEELLDEVLTRVLNNAVLAVQGVPAPTVTVRISQTPTDIRVTVEDNGLGVAADVQPHLFELFFTTRALGMGTGLGLPIALGLMRANGGELSFDGNHPTRFSLTVPLHVRPTTGEHRALARAEPT